jgi:hypothetical protein
MNSVKNPDGDDGGSEEWVSWRPQHVGPPYPTITTTTTSALHDYLFDE